VIRARFLGRVALILLLGAAQVLTRFRLRRAIARGTRRAATLQLLSRAIDRQAVHAAIHAERLTR
jgi:hypothetical protein